MEDETIDDSGILESVPRARGKPGRPKRESAAERPAAPNKARRVGRTESARFQRTVQREEPREEVRGPKLERLSRRNRRGEDKFYVNPKTIPHNTSYEWKREVSYGAKDISHQLSLRENHWTPVPASRHPELVDTGVTSGPITKDGMILMERPLYLTREAQQEDYEIAREQVTGRESKLRQDPEGGFQGGRSHPSARANTRINRSYEPMIVPED